MRRLTAAQALGVLAALLAGALVVSACVGAFSFTPAEVLRYAAQALAGAPGGEGDPDTLRRNVLVALRLPRVLLAGLTGAALAVSGALMQGLFRNPIVEPGLAGTSSGAALGAAAVIVLGAGPTGGALRATLGLAAIPLAAAAGAFGATWLVYRLSRAFGRVDVFTLLLAGVAVNAACGALTGLLSYVARDPQARSITFWSLGTFSTAGWPSVALVGVVAAVGLPIAWRDAKALNALMLGEDEAALLGVDPARLVARLLVVNTCLVAAATATVGVIAFVGLVVPHVLRLLRTADYAFLLPASALLGAALMELVDVVARVAVAPAELPVGIITALVGAPLFLALLRRQRRGPAT